MNSMENIFFEDRKSLDKNINYLVKRKLGNGVFVSKSNEKKDNSNFEMIVGIYLPRIIDDSRTEERTVKFIKFDSIGIIEAKHEDKGFRLLMPDIEELTTRLESKMSSLVFNVQYSLLQTTHQKLVEIPIIRNSLNPIREILVQIYENGKINFEDFKKYRGERKTSNYISFLENLDIVRRNGDNIVSGNQFNIMEPMLRKQDEKKIYNILLADVLRNGFGYIKEYLKLTSITPYIRWSTSYYLPSLQTESLLSLNQRALIRNYTDIYQTKPLEGKAPNQINQLVEAGIFEKQNSFIVGTQEIFDSIALH